MTLHLDDIQYGNPSREDYIIMTVESYLDYLVTDIQKLFPPPKNSSPATKEELNLLFEYSRSNKAETHQHIFDRELVNYIQNLFIENGAPREHILNVTQNIVDEVMPVVTKLKYSFQRPRPFQLARYYRLNLYPYYSYFISSPSYPSTHTTLAAVICEVLGNTYPESYAAMKKLVRDVSESRLYLGVHYPSDNDTALLLSQKIVQNKEFKKKYML